MKDINILSEEEKLFQEVTKKYPHIPSEAGYISDEVFEKLELEKKRDIKK